MLANHMAKLAARLRGGCWFRRGRPDSRDCGRLMRLRLTDLKTEASFEDASPRTPSSRVFLD